MFVFSVKTLTFAVVLLLIVGVGIGTLVGIKFTESNYIKKVDYLEREVEFYKSWKKYFSGEYDITERGDEC